MRVLAVGSMLNSPAVKQAAVEEGIELCFITAADVQKPAEYMEKEMFSAILAGADRSAHTSMEGSPLLRQSSIVAPVSAENIAAAVSTISTDEMKAIVDYFAYGGRENLRHGFRLLRRLAGENVGKIPPPQPVLLDAIYTPNGRLYDSLETYFQGEGRIFSTYVGILSYRSNWFDGDTAVEEAIARSLANRGIGTILAYSIGSPDNELGTMSFEESSRRFFCMDGKLAIDLLISFQGIGIKAVDGKDMFTRSAECFTELDIPVVRPVGLGRKDVEYWRGSKRPHAQDLPGSFLMSELQGVIEPVHIFCSGGEHCRQPIPERVERLTGRIRRWIDLRRLPNEEKKVAIFLHNAPCSGVEATVGVATDLDAFESAVSILHRLKEEGYRVEDVPEDGKALKELIFEKKAYSDFRWTAAEDIAAAGGMLHSMDSEEYAGYFDTLSPDVKVEMEKHWGPLPGEAMVVEGKLLITGLRFGNVLVMVQPKRGCYGAKCTGEVCKILQDPTCPPTHQFLATYWYLSRRWAASAVIHLGTHGSVEFLPGKDCGLSGDCFSDIALDDMVNLYPYNACGASGALIARRRSYAVTISYLPAPGKGLTPEQRRLAEAIRRYFSAQEQDSSQLPLIRQEIEQAAGNSAAAQAVFARETDFDAACRELRALLDRTDVSRQGSSRRTFGEPADRQWVRDYIAELWQNDGDFSALWQEIEDPVERAGTVSALIDAALDAPETIEDPFLLPLAEDARDIAAGLGAASAEMEALIHALSGGYIRPTRGGDAAVGGREILPTGRNLHSAEQDKMPTPAAYQRGSQAAEDLLALYMKEEGRLPEKVSMNMFSLDITRTNGEQLSQFMALMGIRPIWSADGRVTGLHCIPLEELGRPRVDVTIRISSVMRDSWPGILILMDQAVALAANQDEPAEQNYVRANSHKIAKEGGEATGRIFGGQPGTYTSAVGLALRASAWKDDDDLAKYFIDSSSYLYGEGKEGVRTPVSFAANVRQIDLTCDISSSRGSSAVASSYRARVLGGFRLAAKTLGSSKQIRQYMGESSAASGVRMVTMEDHVARGIEDTLLNDIWREQMMVDGYQGAAELMGRMQNLFEIQCVCDTIPADTLDAVVRQYLLDEEMQRWFRENNTFALEESGRRFLELNSRGRWQGDVQVLRQLQRAYLKAEGNLEDGLTGLGDIQAGNVDIIAHDQVESWGKRLVETESLVQKWKK